MDASKTALLLLNLQNDFLKPDGLICRAFRGSVTEQETSRLLGNAKSLLDAARDVAMPVVWVNTVLRVDGFDSALSPTVIQKAAELGDASLLAEGSWGAQVVVELIPERTDIVVVKKGHSAFQSLGPRGPTCFSSGSRTVRTRLTTSSPAPTAARSLRDGVA